MGRDPVTRLYTAIDITWKIIIAKRYYMKQCKTTILEYKKQLDKLFDGRSASRKKAILYSTLRNNKTISNEVFNLQIMGEEKEDNDENRDIDNELGVFNKEDDNNEPVRKKAKTVKKKLELDSVKKASTQSKKEKKSAGVELAQEMRGQHKYYENEYKQQELSKLSPKTQVICKLKEVYADEIDKLNFHKYTCLVLLLCTKNKNFTSCTKAEYFMMIEESGLKFHDELME